MSRYNQLTPEKVQIYNSYVECLNDDLNFEDRSVGIYFTSKLTESIIHELQSTMDDEIVKIKYWNESTLILKDSGYYVTILKVNFPNDEKWIVAEIV